MNFQKPIELNNAVGKHYMDEMQLSTQTKKQDDVCLDEATGEVVMTKKTKFEKNQKQKTPPKT